MSTCYNPLGYITGDQSAYRLDWRMTRGDSIGFEWIAWGVGVWADDFECQIKKEPDDATALVTPTVSYGTFNAGMDLVVRIDNPPSTLLVPGRYHYDVWSPTDKITRWIGTIYVEQDVTR